MKADREKAMTLAFAGEMPIDSAATSLPRRARRVRPTVPSRNWITATETRTRTTRARARNARSDSPKSHGPSTGRGTCVPVSSAVDPPPTQENFTITASKKNANAKVAMASHTPPNRSTGIDRRAPTAAAMSAPRSAASRTDMSHRSAIWNTVNPPIAAKAPWHREICPANPVMTVIER